MSVVLFYLFGSVSLISSIATISVRNPVYSALFFIIALLSLSGLFALLSNTFLFAIQIILYAGAIISLLLFIIMFLGIAEKNIPNEPNRFKTMFVVAVLLLPFVLAVIRGIEGMPANDLSMIIDSFGSLKNVGLELFKSWVFPFELISILLLIALLGAVTLGKGARND
ncbi:MAG: NADH-quinone oxidoreductase subunit [Campylobacterota bacterium]|nr:NADH-quinone oxidoreductase subunit [Campylobacterota bacterium]